MIFQNLCSNGHTLRNNEPVDSTLPPVFYMWIEVFLQRLTQMFVWVTVRKKACTSWPLFTASYLSKSFQEFYDEIPLTEFSHNKPSSLLNWRLKKKMVKISSKSNYLEKSVNHYGDTGHEQMLTWKKDLAIKSTEILSNYLACVFFIVNYQGLQKLEYIWQINYMVCFSLFFFSPLVKEAVWRMKSSFLGIEF